MPFKTKKKKKSANKNRINILESGLLEYNNSREVRNRLTDNSTLNRTTSGVISEKDSLGVRKELIKIFLLASVIIGLQLALKISDIPIFN